MSNEEKNDMPLLIRSLSEDHWMAAKVEMVKKHKTVQWAGRSLNWCFQIVRESPNTRDAIQQTFFEGKLVSKMDIKLPKAYRCLGKNVDGKRCKRKVVLRYCKDH